MLSNFAAVAAIFLPVLVGAGLILFGVKGKRVANWRCSKCNYVINHVPATCPECGFLHSSALTLKSRHILRKRIFAGVGILLVTVTVSSYVYRHALMNLVPQRLLNIMLYTQADLKSVAISETITRLQAGSITSDAQRSIAKKSEQILADARSSSALKYAAIIVAVNLSIQDDRLTHSIWQCLNDTDPDVRIIAMEAFARKASSCEAVVDVAVQLTVDPDPIARIAAFKILSDTTCVSTKVWSAMSGFDSEVDSSVRAWMIRTADRHSATDSCMAIAVIRKGLNDNIEVVRFEAAECLLAKGYSDDELIRTIADMLVNSDAATVSVLINRLARCEDDIRKSVSLNVEKLSVDGRDNLSPQVREFVNSNK